VSDPNEEENEARLYREKERLLARMVAARMWDVFSNSPPRTPAANTNTQPSRRNPGLAGASLSRSQAPLTYGDVRVDDRRGKVRSPQQERRNKSPNPSAGPAGPRRDPNQPLGGRRVAPAPALTAEGPATPSEQSIWEKRGSAGSRGSAQIRGSVS
jgi:hypothetical protein